MSGRYIDADDLSRRMYHEAFEVDSDMQRWDSGCWIRYKVFENCIAATPTADVVPKEKYDKLLENATILADAVRKYEKMFEQKKEVEKSKGWDGDYYLEDC